MAQRILKGTTATLILDLTDADGAAIAATGTLTVGVTKADSTIVLAAGTATVASSTTGRYSVVLPASGSANLNLLTAVWTDSANPTGARTTTHEIVGGYLFTLADMRSFGRLTDAAQYPNPMLISRRAEVEDELEQMRGVAFVPRYARLILDGSGDTELLTGFRWPRSVVSATVRTAAGQTIVPYTTAATDLTLTEDGRIVLVNGNIWAFGRGNITVELEHGYTDWGKDLFYAGLRRLQHLLFRPVAAIPDQAATGVGFGGATFTVAGPDANSTGIAEVDAIYARYPRLSKSGNMPASRPMDWDPQFLAVFRGGRS